MLRKIAASLINYTFIAMMLVVIFCVAAAPCGDYCINNNNGSHSILMGVVISLGLIFIYRRIKRWDVPKWLEFTALAIYLVIQLLATVAIAQKIAVKPSWDPGYLMENVENILQNGFRGNESNYIQFFPFQFPTVVLHVYYLKALHFFGIVNNDRDALIVLQSIFVVMSSLFTYLAVRKIANQKKAILALIILTLITPVVLYVPVLYTDIPGMCFTTIALYGAICLIKEKRSEVKAVALSMIFAVLIFIAKSFKNVAMILLIATMIYILILSKNKLKDKLIKISVILAVFIPLSIAAKTITASIYDSDKALAKTNWIVMSMKSEYGGYNYDYFLKGAWKALDGEDTTPMNVQDAKEQLSQWGVKGTINFLAKKIAYTWGDGTYFVSEKLSREPEHSGSRLYSLVADDGSRFEIYRVIANGIQSSALIVLLLGAFETRKARGITVMLKLAIIGLFTFLLIWEARSRYLISSISFIVVLQACFISRLSKYRIKTIKSNKSR